MEYKDIEGCSAGPRTGMATTLGRAKVLLQEPTQISQPSANLQNCENKLLLCQDTELWSGVLHSISVAIVNS